MMMSASLPREYSFTISTPTSRLDKFLTEQLPDITRSQVQRLVEEGHVAVNGKVEKAGYRLRAGDAVRVEVPAAIPSHLAPESIPIPILYEDDDVLVVDKPAGLTVHPAPGHPGSTLVNAILLHLGEGAGEVGRPGIVHRLDKDTSGVMVVARNTRAHADLAEQFKRHEVTKVYLALVKGRLTPEHGVIEGHIGRDTGDRKKMAIAAESRGRHARTSYRVLRYVDGYSLLEVRPETGRTHQIRVHLAAIGHPVVGDATYGARSSLVSRQFLHAHRLGFRVPSTGEYREFVSPLPPDLDRALKGSERL